MPKPVSLILYYRHGCHLCEDFELALGEFLIDWQAETGQDVEVVIRDVDSQAEWRREFNESVPVLFYHQNGESKEVCKYYFEPPSLHQYLI